MKYQKEQHTFLLCAYKESPYLESCIQSLLKQTKKSNILVSTSTPCEFIKQIVKKYDLELVINNGKQSIADDWNYGYKQVRTPLITIAHQDDIYKPAFLEETLKLLNKSESPLIVFTDYGELRNGKEIHQNTLLKVKRILLFPLRFPIFYKSRFIRRRSLSFGSGICCPSVTYVKPNLPDTIFTCGYRSDIDWQAWEKLSRLKGEFLYCNKKLMLHRIHEASATTEIIKDNQRSKEDFEMFCKFWPACIAKILIKFYNKGEKSNYL